MSTQVVTATQAGAVATAGGKKDLQAWFKTDQFKLAVAAALPQHITSDRFVRLALNALMRTPKLAECTQESVFKAMLDLSALGLEPDGRRAHLIPFKRNVKLPGGGWTSLMECQLIIDYKGLVELAYRSGTISNIHADRVCENDEFDYDRGLVLAHRIDFRKDRGKAFAYYCRVVFKDKTEVADVMTLAEVGAIRARSKSANDGPWVTDFDEMAKKTVFKRLSKWLTLSPEFRDAVDKDEDASVVAEVPRRAPQAETATITLDSFAPSADENRGHDHAAEVQPVEEQADPGDAVDPLAVVSEARAEQVREAVMGTLNVKERSALWAQYGVANPYQLINSQADLILEELAAKAK